MVVQIQLSKVSPMILDERISSNVGKSSLAASQNSIADTGFFFTFCTSRMFFGRHLLRFFSSILFIVIHFCKDRK